MLPSSGTLDRLNEAIRPFLLEGRSGFHQLLLGSTFAVLVGIVLEVWEISHDVLEELRQNFQTRKTAPELVLTSEGVPSFSNRRSWMKTVGAVGWLLVSIGVAGEFWFDSVISDFDTGIRLIDDGLLQASRSRTADAEIRAALAGKEASAANERTLREIEARVALEKDLRAQGPRWLLLREAAPRIVKQISPFKGQKVVALMCSALFDRPETDQTFSVLVGSILSEGAKWSINNHGSDPPFRNCSTGPTRGVMIEFSPHATGLVRDAATALTTALRDVIPSSIVKTMPMAAPPWNAVFEPFGKEHPFNLLIGHPELIVVVVGANPEE